MINHFRLLMFYAGFFALLTLLAVPSESLGAKKKQITMMFPLHIDNTKLYPYEEGASFQSTSVKRQTDMFEKYKVKGFYQFCGDVLLYLLEDYPETVEQIKRLKMPIGYHGGAGHNEPNQFGRQRMIDTSGMTKEEAERAELIASWDFETHTLITNWRYDEDMNLIMNNPRAGERITIDELPDYKLPKEDVWLYGGRLAIQKIFGVRIIEYRGRGIPYGSIPLTFGKEVDEAVELPDMHEPYMFPDKRNLPYKYYGKNFGEDVPRIPDTISWLRSLAASLPDGYTYYIPTMMHGVNLDIVGEDLENLLRFLTSHPEDFRVVWPDPNEIQWEPQNNALSFYQKTYGVSSFKEVRDMPCPVDKILEMQEESSIRSMPRERAQTQQVEKVTRKKIQDRTRLLTREQMIEATEDLLTQWPRSDHDANYGGPPRYIKIKGNFLSLADTYQSLVFFLSHYAQTQSLPDKVTISPVMGPIDYPMIYLREKPVIDPIKRAGGYMPRELDREFFPDPELIQAQGLPMQEGNHLWMPAHAIAQGDNILHTAWEAEKVIKSKKHIPGVSLVGFLSYESKYFYRNAYIELQVNAGELLYALAQEFRIIEQTGLPGSVAMVSMKISSDQDAMLVAPYTPYQGNGPNHISSLKHNSFVYRVPMTEAEIDVLWNYVPD